MFDQSFSAKNFFNIIVNENRKGVNLEKQFFEIEIFKKYTLKIKDNNKKLKIDRKSFINNDKKGLNPKNRTPDVEFYKRYKRYIRQANRTLKKEKTNTLFELLEKISENIGKHYFKLHLTQKSLYGKSIYTTDNSAEAYFATKQLQYNFKKLYGVKQANRFEIVKQVKCILNNKFPKYIIRTDVKQFYETIPNETIINHLNKDNLLSPKSKRFIKQILNEYKTLSGKPKGKGIPRGTGISAYLAEYYMRKIDRSIIDIKDVTYYSRYVDDIIIVFTPKYTHNSNDYMKLIKTIIEKNTPLKLHKKKTVEIDLLKNSNEIIINNITQNTPYKLNYLGYSFELLNKENKQKIPEIKVILTDEKIKRYKLKIKKSFEAYSRYSDKKKGYRHLRNRIKFLTGNTRLANNKSQVLVGIYFSNLLLTEPNTLKELDKYLKWHIGRYIKSANLKDKLNQYRFLNGFNQKKFYRFSQNRFKQIISVWKIL